MTATYVFDPAWHAEQRRLRCLEALWDDASQALLVDAGLTSGSHCLEVGAGAGSLATWMRARAGEEGRVVATDLDTRFLGPAAAAGVEVVAHDVMHDPLPERQFDVVHARLLVEHLGVGALSRLAACARPGGVVVVEDYDFSSAVAAEQGGPFERVTSSLLAAMASRGFDPWLGRRLPAELEAAGLAQVRAVAATRFVRGGTAQAEFYRLSLLTLQTALGADAAATGDVDALLRRLDDPSWWALLPVLVGAVGVTSR